MKKRITEQINEESSDEEAVVAKLAVDKRKLTSKKNAQKACDAKVAKCNLKKKKSEADLAREKFQFTLRQAGVKQAGDGERKIAKTEDEISESSDVSEEETVVKKPVVRTKRANVEDVISTGQMIQELYYTKFPMKKIQQQQPPIEFQTQQVQYIAPPIAQPQIRKKIIHI